MTSRTRQEIIHFGAAFFLPGFEAPQPAGDYRVDYDEESIDGASWVGWHNVGTFLHLPAITACSSTSQMMPVDFGDLQIALEKDQKQ